MESWREVSRIYCSPATLTGGQGADGSSPAAQLRTTLRHNPQPRVPQQDQADAESHACKREGVDTAFLSFPFLFPFLPRSLPYQSLLPPPGDHVLNKSPAQDSPLYDLLLGSPPSNSRSPHIPWFILRILASVAPSQHTGAQVGPAHAELFCTYPEHARQQLPSSSIFTTEGRRAKTTRCGHLGLSPAAVSPGYIPQRVQGSAFHGIPF